MVEETGLEEMLEMSDGKLANANFMFKILSISKVPWMI